jgi:hypothetical protein
MASHVRIQAFVITRISVIVAAQGVNGSSRAVALFRLGKWTLGGRGWIGLERAPAQAILGLHPLMTPSAPPRAPTVREGFLRTRRLNQAQFPPSRSGLWGVWRAMSNRAVSKEISTCSRDVGKGKGSSRGHPRLKKALVQHGPLLSAVQFKSVRRF